MRRIDPAWVLAILLLGAAAALYSADWVEVTEDVGFSSEAYRKPYLAATRFLEGRNVQVQMSDGLAVLDELPPTDHVLLLASARGTLSEDRVEGLRRWVRDGGHLIVAATELSDSATGQSGDPLLDPLGVELYEDAASAALPLLQSREPSRRFEALISDSGCSAQGGLTLLSVPSEPQTLLLAMHASRYLAYTGPESVEAASSVVGPQLLRLPSGAGEITVVTTLTPWRNDRVGCADHAYVLHWLMDARDQLWWLRNTEMPNLLTLLWQRYSQALLLLTFALLLWAWRQAYRGVRPRPEPVLERRALREHLEALARFRWQQGNGARLLEPLVPSAGEAPPADAAATDERAFTAAVAALQRAREDAAGVGAAGSQPVPPRSKSNDKGVPAS